MITKRNKNRPSTRHSRTRNSLAGGDNMMTYRARQVELKDSFLPLTGTFGSVGSTSVSQFLAISQGIDANQRIGRHITVTGFEVVGNLIGGQSNLSTDDRYNQVRIAIVQTNAGQAPTMDLVSPLDPRFNSAVGLRRVLFDQVYTLVSPGKDSTGYMPAARRIEIRGRCNIPIVFNGSGGSTACVNTVGIVMVSDSGLAPNPGFTQGYWRLLYHDA